MANFDLQAILSLLFYRRGKSGHHRAA